MNSKKGLKYYAIIFFFSVFALVVYVGYLAIKEGSIDYELAYSLVLVPFMFTLFLFAFDKIFDRIFPSKTKKENSHYNVYLKQIGEVINDKCDFSIESYRRLRGNYSFQKSVEQAYRILTDGETEELNFIFLEKKFKKNTNEYIALSVVIEEVKKMLNNS